MLLNLQASAHDEHTSPSSISFGKAHRTLFPVYLPIWVPPPLLQSIQRELSLCLRDILIQVPHQNPPADGSPRPSIADSILTQDMGISGLGEDRSPLSMGLGEPEVRNSESLLPGTTWLRPYNVLQPTNSPDEWFENLNITNNSWMDEYTDVPSYEDDSAYGSEEDDELSSEDEN